MRVEGQATFLSAGDRLLHLWVHGPATGRVHGAVVIAPALVREEVVSHRSMRLVAARAAERGWMAVRLTYSGTSESGERPPGSDPVEVWHRDLADVYTYLRAVVGENAPIHAIGLRVGAALVASSKVPFGQRLLWEPVSGDAFIRQYGRLRRTSGLVLPPVQETGVEISGALFTDAEAQSIRSLPDPRKSPDRGSEIVREEDRRVAKKLYGVASIYAKASPSSIAAIVDRLEYSTERAVCNDNNDDDGHNNMVDVSGWMPQSSARVHVAEFGVDVVEELLEIGDDRLPASYTRPVDSHGTGKGAVNFAPPSAEPKDGPTGLWAFEARRLAARGIPTLRLDRHHCADAAGLEQVKDSNPYTVQGASDIEAGARWLQRRTGEDVTGVGLCVGGWLVATAPPESVMRRRVILNNVAWRPAESYYDRLYRHWDVDLVLEKLRNMGDVHLNRTLRTRVKDKVRRRMPYSFWLLLGKLSIPNVPEVVMEIATRTAEVFFYFGPEDGLLFVQERGEEGVRRLRRRGRRLAVTHLETLDHSLQANSSRVTAISIIEANMGLAPHPERVDQPKSL